MALTVSGDSSHPGGGYAILSSDEAAIPEEIAVEDRSLGVYLGADGQWKKAPTLLRVESLEPGVARLGPSIVDAIPSDTQLAFHASDGTLLGNLVWPAIRPSAGAAGGPVLPDSGAFVASPRLASAPPARAASPRFPLSKRAPASPPAPAPLAAATPASRRPRWLFAAAALVVALALLALLRDGPLERRLVCGEGAPLQGRTFGGVLAACPAPADPEQLAFAAFQQCAAGHAGCAAKVCAEGYLPRFEHGAHADEVGRAAGATSNACAAADFAEFGQCLATAGPCEQSSCVERWKASLTGEPYAATLRQAAQTAAAACEKTKEEAAFSVFNHCVAGAADCDKARCAADYPSEWRKGEHGAEIERVVASADLACRAETERKKAEQDFAAYQTCMRGASACDQAACVDRWQASLTAEPYATTLRQARDAATAACATVREATAFSDFNRCVAAAGDCDKARCAADYPSQWRQGAHGAEIDRVTGDADRACRAEADRKKAEQDFAAFQTCMRGASACEQGACVDRWQSSLAAEPYATALRQARDAATAACATLREATAFSDFNRCVAAAGDCDKARCAAAYPSQWRQGAHGGEIDRVIADADRACRAEADRKKTEQDFAAFQACLREASPCDQAACVDRWQSSLAAEPWASSLTQARTAAAENCQRSRDEEAFNGCASQSVACDRATCFSALPASARQGAQAAEIDSQGKAAEEACAASRRPTPDQAARAFVLRYYRAHSAAGQEAGERLEDLYGPVVVAYGQSVNRDQLVAEKQKYFRKYTNLEFTVDEDSVTVNCDSDGRQCLAEGQVSSNAYNTESGRSVSGRSRFTLTLHDVTSDPRVAAETAKPIKN
jgi:hypothetical protein